MWWNIIPSGAVIWGAFTVLELIEDPVLYLTYGKATFRRAITNQEAWFYLRDVRLGDGNVYNTKALENIPDPEPEPKK